MYLKVEKQYGAFKDQIDKIVRNSQLLIRNISFILIMIFVILTLQAYSRHHKHRK